MSTAERIRGKDCIPQIEEYVKQGFSLTKAFEQVSQETGVSLAALRMAFWREVKESPRRSFKFAFTEEEEKVLVAACMIHAHQGIPLTFRDFIEMASIFAKRDANRPFSRQFVYDFIDRHQDVLCKKNGKITSPTRCLDTTQEKTQDFISLVDMHMKGNTMNKRNIFVFDETTVGDDVSLPIVIGMRRKSGGGNNNVFCIREKKLGCYIPFSMPDGSTPFRVFIFASGSKKEGRILPHALVPTVERRQRTRPHRLFLQSEKGSLTLELFKIIMEEFIKWWKGVHPGLHCFLISDNLSIHRNSGIVKKARKHGIHMLNIMPGTSHWFQVHDQLPFANLKKKMTQKKNRLSRSFSLTRQRRRALLMGFFYKAERKALRPHIVRKSFSDVGLWPFNPQKILQICQNHCPVDSKNEENEMLRDLIDAINVHKQKQEKWCNKILSGMEAASMTEAENYDFQIFRDDDDDESASDVGDEDQSSFNEDYEDMPMQPPTKRKRTPTTERKTCSARGCQKSHFWSKKWVECPKCKKNFCPSHAKKLQRHKCHNLSFHQLKS